MQTIKKVLFTSFLALSCLLSSGLLADNFDPMDDLITGPMPAPIDPAPGDECIDAAGILQLITPEFCQNNCSSEGTGGGFINFPAIVKEDLYLSTVGPITRRSLLDEPSLRNYILEDCWVHFTMHPFYNYTPRVIFASNSPYICSYLFPNENVLTQIKNALTMANLGTINISDALNLVRNFKLQQHRVGIMFGLGSKLGALNLSIRTPLYYIVEHFFLTRTETETLDSFVTNTFDRPDLTSQGSGVDFGTQHLVSDRLGFGDTRINGMFSVYESSRDHFWFGVQMTIPTAVTFKAGLIGGTFSPCTPVPPLNIKELVQLFLCAESDIDRRGAEVVIRKTLADFGVGAVDRLTTILFNTPLGNGGHFGIGPQLDFIHELTENWSLQTYAAFEGFSKHLETRFFVRNKWDAEFNRDWRDEANAEENLRFLNQQFIDNVYPTPLRLGVRPGYLGKYATSLVCDSLNWHGFVGFDYWYQSAEKLYVNPELIACFNIEKGLREAAHQGKFFFSFGYRNIYHFDRVFFDVEFTGDISCFSKNIGNSYTLGFRLSLDI